GIRMTPWASFIVGYSFLYVSSVARPGDQIDPVINPNTSPAIGGNFSGIPSSPPHPALNIRDTDFWAQGLTFALEFRYCEGCPCVSPGAETQCLCQAAAGSKGRAPCQSRNSGCLRSSPCAVCRTQPLVEASRR